MPELAVEGTNVRSVTRTQKQVITSNIGLAGDQTPADQATWPDN